MIKLDEKKLAGLKTGSQHLAETYGEKGTPWVSASARSANTFLRLNRDRLICSSRRSCSLRTH